MKFELYLISINHNIGFNIFEYFLMIFIITKYKFNEIKKKNFKIIGFIFIIYNLRLIK